MAYELPTMRSRSLDHPYRRNLWNEESVRANLIASKDMTVLQAGEAKIHVHKTLLCWWSKYYDRALNGHFVEASQGLQPVTASEDTLRHAVQWMYTGKLQKRVENRTRVRYLRLSIDDAVEVYLFADQYDILALRRAAISTMSAVYMGDSAIASNATINKAVANTVISSPLCRFFIDAEGHHDCFKPRHGDAELDSDFLSAVAQAIGDGHYDEDELCRSCYEVCNFHEHESEDEKAFSEFLTVV